MLQAHLSRQHGVRLAEALGTTANTAQALELLSSGLQEAFGCPVVILSRQGSGWSPIGGPDAGTQAGFDAPLHFSFESGVRVVTFEGLDGTATAVQLACESDSDQLAFAIPSDWSASAETLTQWSMGLTHALVAVRARDMIRRTRRFLVSGYGLSRRLSRLNNADTIASSVVAHVSRMLDAERVSLALYRKTEAYLTIAATHGYPASRVADVRIAPGDWVIGHVYATGRPVFVRDAGALTGAAHGDRYRSRSFAVVPVVAGAETIGVLSVTERRDDRPFDKEELMALRALAASAGTALASAHTSAEAARLSYAATTDSLTGLLNRTYLDGRLHQEIERAKRESGMLALLISDIDDFKSINDRWGHQVGDRVLEAVGSVIRNAVRVFDICARYGGDEFAIVMPNSDGVSAAACAERIQRLLAEYRNVEADNARVTMSIGVAVFGAGDSAADLIARADRCMYQAKVRGKNRVITPAPQAVEPAAQLLAASPVNREAPPAVRLVEPPGTSVDASPTGLPYVLVADAREDRASFCREAVAGLQRGLLITRDGEQAMRAITQFGAPALLIVDLALPAQDGFSMIEAVRRREGRQPPIIAWTSSRAMREYAASRFRGLDVHVIADTTSPSAMRATILHVLDPQPAAATPQRSDPDALRKRMADLANRAHQLCGTPGVAIYLRASGEAKFRASFGWQSDDLMPNSPSHLPRAFDRITQTGESIFIPDTTLGGPAGWSGESDDAVRGLAGVPIVENRQVLGAICVFDTRPLSLTEGTMTALRSLGQMAFELPRAVPPLPAVGFRDRAADRAPVERAVSEPDPWLGDAEWPLVLLERQGGEFAVARERARARREGHQLSVILFDLAAAQAGEQTIDEDTLDSVTETLLRAIRQSDLPIRWSGSELLVVLPGLADPQARIVAERVRAALHAGARYRLAISGGVVELQADERFGDVVARARQRVAIARGRGHNRVL